MCVSSEHCSYSELREFVSWVNPKRVIPTVNCANNEAVQKMLAHFEAKPLKRPDYGTLFPLIKHMRVQAAKQQAEAEARAEMENIDEEEPPLRLVVADSQLLLLEGQGEPEDAYVRLTKQEPDSPILISDDAADLPPSEASASETLAIIPAAASTPASGLTHVKTAVWEAELVDLEALASNASFIEEQRHMEALLANEAAHPTPTRSYSAPPAHQQHQQQQQQQQQQGTQTPPSQRKSRSFGELSEKQPKKAKKSTTPDPKQPTLFSFLTRSKSSNLQ